LHLASALDALLVDRKKESMMPDGIENTFKEGRREAR
jgi:hypothetical protein